MIIFICIMLYFTLLYAFSRLTSRGSHNASFFSGDRQSQWQMVAFGMIGASISGVTFVSVPGMVINFDMTYLQTCLGFIPGYFIVALVLLPIYYKHRLITIYSFLNERLGRKSHKTGSMFFLLSKMTGAAVRFYLVCMVLQRFVLDAYGVPFAITVATLVTLIWLYTRRGGIKTLVMTDTFQTLCMLTAVVLITVHVMKALGMNWTEAAEAVMNDSHSRMFVTDDWVSKQNFWKQFLSGIFIVIVMTGLDQDMMQKNLTCKSLREAQKNMCCYGMAFVPVNFLFMCLGVLLVQLAAKQGIALPDKTDELLPMFAASGSLGTAVLAFFSIGIVAASFSSADSAMTAMTTTFCVDILEKPDDERTRKSVHVAVAFVFALFIMLFQMLNSTSIIDAIYIMCSYTYGPLLGLFAFAMFARKRKADDNVAPYVAIASPLICYALDMTLQKAFDYHIGYEMLMFNGLLTFTGLYVFSSKNN